MLWLTRLLDLTSLNFFPWGCLKNKIYSRLINNIQDITQCVSTEISKITEINYIILTKYDKKYQRKTRKCLERDGKTFGGFHNWPNAKPLLDAGLSTLRLTVSISPAPDQS